ncbi:MAG: UDP-3-O-(3-hydroxymyristoyl)glucosamine N-acyltransferase [Bacteroidia bacterium]|nr:UDP-3-O-(3-hydroxymyristoyl)glucosamine N-acyltransferase [Bacteroidia bacterium]
MQITAIELCKLLNGTIEGDPDVVIKGPSKIEEGTPGTISFFANPKYESFIYTTKASALLIPREFKPTKEVASTLIRVDNVYGAISQLLDAFGHQPSKPKGISEHALVHDSVKAGDNLAVAEFVVIGEQVNIGNDVTIYPQVFIGKNVKIGSNVTLYPGVKIYHSCEIGDNCVIHSNTVIGGDGFGFLPKEDGTYTKVNHTGNVILEDDVEIGSNSTIDRATIGSTVIKKGAKLDNLIHIAHNVEIGYNTVIAAQTGIAGSTKIGDNCMIGGQCGFVGHIAIADGSKFQAKSGISSSIKEPNKEYYGYPVLRYSQYQRSYVHFKNLPQLAKRVLELEKKLAVLEQSSKTVI